MLTNLLIIIGCIAALVGGLIVLFASNPMRSLLGLFLTSIALGILYLLLGGSLVAMAQIIVYAGAVLMLFLFVIRYFMKKLSPSRLPAQFTSAIVVILILILLVLIPISSLFQKLWFSLTFSPPDPAAIGKNLFERYVYAFELITVLLLAAIVGAIYMARAEDEFYDEEDDGS